MPPQGLRAARAAVLLLCLLLLGGSLMVQAALHDKARGFKTYRTPQGQVDDFLRQHHPDAVLHRHKNKEAMKEHPEVQKFLEWREKFQAGHEGAGAAFAGKIPHDFIPHLATMDEQSAQAAGEGAPATAGAPHDEL